MMRFRNKFFKYAAAILMVLVILFLIGQMSFVFEPIKKIIAVIFFPLIVAGLFYYLLRPLLRLFEKTKINRTLAILLIFILVTGILALLGTYAGSLIGQQFTQLNANLPSIIQDVQDRVMGIINNKDLGWLFTTNVQNQITSSIQNLVPMLIGNIFGAFSTLASIAFVLIMVPFILFFFLKDDGVFEKRLLDIVPKRYLDVTKTVLDETDKTLSTYIMGQAIIALVNGTMMYVGYLIIGLQYPLILALFATFTAFIPMFGSAIGIAPAILIGLSGGPITVIQILVIMIIAQQLEGNFIAPVLVGKRMDIHPLIMIIILMVAASLYGFVGMLISVPLYALVKLFVKNFIKIYKLKKATKARVLNKKNSM